ncbi:CRISPR-associated protein, Cas02710 family [Leptolyngbya sp. PCC 7375]|nr:CRISPR-associated protein, Cas02710 family [Leptolyngbya sp. PCC 7375]
MQRNPVLEAIADPTKNFLAFLLIGIFGLGIISGGISNLLLETLGDWLQNSFGINKILFQLLVVGFISLLILFSIYFTNLARRIRELLGHEEIQIKNILELTDTFIGLIAIPSLGRPGKKTPAELAIRHHWKQGRGKLRYCWLICTPDALDSTREFLQVLKQECIDDQFGCEIYDQTNHPFPPITQIGTSLHIRLMVLDPRCINDPNHIRELVDGLYDTANQQTGLTSPEIIADYTGGTKSMTAGIVLACTEPNRPLQYLLSQYGANGEITASQLMKVMLSYRIRAVR